MQVRILTRAAGPDGSFSPGDVADFDKERAFEWIKAGAAESIESGPIHIEAPELAEEPDDAEQAVEPDPKKKRKGGRR